MIFLVRHAHAGERAAWRDADELRPLSPRGWQEAAGLARRLGGFRLSAVRTSGALRCIQTVEDLAVDRGLPLLLDDRLGRDAAPEGVLELAAHDGAVLCTHGELIGRVLDLLRSLGAPVPADAEYPKGSTWLLDDRGGTAWDAVYLPPLRAWVHALR